MSSENQGALFHVNDVDEGVMLPGLVYFIYYSTSAYYSQCKLKNKKKKQNKTGNKASAKYWMELIH